MAITDEFETTEQVYFSAESIEDSDDEDGPATHRKIQETMQYHRAKVSVKNEMHVTSGLGFNFSIKTLRVPTESSRDQTKEANHLSHREPRSQTLS